MTHTTQHTDVSKEVRPGRAGGQATPPVQADGSSISPVQADGSSALPAKFGLIIRVIELYFILTMLTILAWALLLPASLFDYDITLFRILAVMVTSSGSVWLIEKRADTTRVFVVVSMIVVIVLSVLDIYFGGEYERIAALVGWPALITGGVLYFGASGAIVIYFLFSPKVDELFVEPPDDFTKPTRNPRENIEEKPFTWPWFRNLGIYYFTFSIVGHWAEILFCWLIVFGIVMGDYDFSRVQLWNWWLCPYPAEGIAVVLIAILLYPVKEWLLDKTHGRVWLALILSFFINMLVCAGIDFLTGISANADYQLWDYRNLPFNFIGQIVLQNTLVYSIAATFIVWIVYPLMAKWLHRMPSRYANGIFFMFVAFYLFLEIMYYVHLGSGGISFG